MGSVKKVRCSSIFRLKYLIFFVSALVFGLVFLGGSVSSGDFSTLAHDSTITITPDIANCNNLGNTFTLHVKNNAGSSDDLLQVEIYKALAGISDFSCGDAPEGWTYLPWPGGDRCIYVTPLNSSSKIKPGEEKDFTFKATMSSDSCKSTFVVVTVDDAFPVGDRKTYNANVNIDCTPPLLTKTVGNPKVAGSGFDWWINYNSILNFYASDNKTTNVCNLGLDYCEYRVLLDGGALINWKRPDIGDVYNLIWQLQFAEDSQHKIEVRCVDKAGNQLNYPDIDNCVG